MLVVVVVEGAIYQEGVPAAMGSFSSRFPLRSVRPSAVLGNIWPVRISIWCAHLVQVVSTTTLVVQSPSASYAQLAHIITGKGKGFVLTAWRAPFLLYKEQSRPTPANPVRLAAFRLMLADPSVCPAVLALTRLPQVSVLASRASKARTLSAWVVQALGFVWRVRRVRSTHALAPPLAMIVSPVLLVHSPQLLV